MVKANLIFSLAALAAAQVSASSLRVNFRTSRALESAGSVDVAPVDGSSSATGDYEAYQEPVVIYDNSTENSWGWPEEAASPTWSDAIGPFGQCGGTGYFGNTTCVPNFVCIYQNEGFSQCLQPAEIEESSASNTTNGAFTFPPFIVLETQSVGNSTDVIDVETDITDIIDENPSDIPIKEVTEATSQVPVKESPKDDGEHQFEEAPLEDFPTVTESVDPWQQCGGLGYSGSSDCIIGYQCDVINAYYHQCLPIHSQDQANFWSQCGGVYHKGPTECVIGASCVYYNDWYSQCVPNHQ